MAENYKPFSLMKETTKRTQDFTDKSGKKIQKIVETTTIESAMFYTDRALAQMALEQMEKKESPVETE